MYHFVCGWTALIYLEYIHLIVVYLLVLSCVLLTRHARAQLMGLVLYCCVVIIYLNVSTTTKYIIIIFLIIGYHTRERLLYLFGYIIL